MKNDKQKLLDFYIHFCLEKKINPSSIILKIIQNNELRIEGLSLTDSHLDAVLNFMQVCWNQDVKCVGVIKLIIDDQSMNDERISQILRSIQP